MKKKIYSIILTSVILMTFGCADVMEKTDLGQLLADDIWENPYLVKGYMDQIINDNLANSGTTTFGATEESYSRYGETGYFMNSYSINYEAGAWPYKGIRNINKFLENVDRCPSYSLSDELKAQYKAQLLIMRGWLYFNMVRMYGGVPLILREQSANDDLYVKRAKTSECIEQIVRDFDSVIVTTSLPMRWEDEANAGRLSKALAYALKARVLLYYASPQFSSQTPAGTKDVDTRWNEAYAACREAKEKLAAAGYGLFRPTPAGFDEAVQTFYDLFMTEVPVNREVIGVRRYYYPNYTHWGHTYTECTLEWANAFNNADGSPFTALEIPAGSEIGVSLKESDVPYWIGREPRFYAYVAHNGVIWPRYVRLAFSEDTDEAGKMRHHWAIAGLVTDPFVTIDDNIQSGSIRLRKMIDTDNKQPIDNVNYNGMDWILCRYAEVLLNFAETAVMTGHNDEAMEVMQAIRRRAGIPEGDNNYGLGSATGNDLLVLILKERLLELSHEADGFRFYDMRRWRLYTEAINGYTMQGFVRHTIRPSLKTEDNSYDRSAMKNLDIINDPDSYFEMFEDHIYALDAQPFTCAERQYFFLLSFDGHIRRNPNLEQTQGWGENATFNPYE